ncbi:hypothetical protein [Leeia sp.]|uniref:hypothetical protein n=1 Tax=Leeia sp. TaxID=2884678 RepID=UPI0035AE2D4F
MTSEAQDFDDWWEQEQLKEEADRRRKAEPKPELSPEEFLAWRGVRRGIQHPTRFDHPLWHWLVRTHWNAFQANEQYFGPSPFDAGPMWCFDRFGQSETTLPDGRVVYIGGEHEDHYDPDFYIYNDVTIIAPDGQIAIYGYPEADFPPTDFHSATRVGDDIYIIGRLGYPESRQVHTTPVYKLSLTTLRIEAVPTHGESPGWLHQHEATLMADGHTLLIRGGELWLGDEPAMRENVEDWSFDTRCGLWQRLSRKGWQHWVMHRVDKQRNRLWDTRREAWDQANPGFSTPRYWQHPESPDLEALQSLYMLPGVADEVSEGSDYNVFYTCIDGLKVRFRETSFWVEAIVEGQLSPARLHALQQHTLALLARIDHADYCIEGMPTDNGPTPS